MWFKNYLEHRTQSVKIGTDLASPVQCTRGVPQGSVLEPVLYSLYVRRVPETLSFVTTIQYADDICFFASGKHVPDIATTLSESLAKLNDFLEQRSLLLNSSKTQVMLVSSSRSSPPGLNVHLSGNHIEQVKCAKYLSLHIDEHLTFCNHVHKIVSKVAGLTSALRRNRRKLDIKSRRMFYLAMIQPHIEYSSNAFVNLISTDMLNMIYVASNDAIRAVFGLPH